MELPHNPVGEGWDGGDDVPIVNDEGGNFFCKSRHVSDVLEVFSREIEAWCFARRREKLGAAAYLPWLLIKSKRQTNAICGY